MKTAHDIIPVILTRTLGCTEPAAIAYAASIAQNAAGGDVQHVDVLLDPYTYRNAMLATIPNTHKECGIEIAATLGALFGNKEDKLEIFKEIDIQKVNSARRMVETKKTKVDIDTERPPLYIDATVTTTASVGRAVISGNHTNISLIEVNGKARTDHKETQSEVLRILKDADIQQISALAEQLTGQDEKLLLKGAQDNIAIARYGLANEAILSIGPKLQQTYLNKGEDNYLDACKTLVSAAIDARMSGIAMPVHANSWSGNQGLLITIPIIELAARNRQSKSTTAHALALAHLVGAHVRLNLGELSAVCGSAIAGAIGAGAGILMLKGGKGIPDILIEKLINGVILSLAGMFCFGANASCALKLNLATNVAIETALLILKGLDIPAATGIASSTAENSLSNLSRIIQSMDRTEHTIVEIMRMNKPSTMNA